MSESKKGEGTVLPPSSLPPADTLPESYEVKIDGFDDSGLVRCIYPGEFVKHHQAATVEDLATQVVNQLRGRYGTGAVEFTSVPKAIKAGQSFKVGA